MASDIIGLKLDMTTVMQSTVHFTLQNVGPARVEHHVMHSEWIHRTVLYSPP